MEGKRNTRKVPVPKEPAVYLQRKSMKMLQIEVWVLKFHSVVAQRRERPVWPGVEKSSFPEGVKTWMWSQGRVSESGVLGFERLNHVVVHEPEWGNTTPLNCTNFQREFSISFHEECMQHTTVLRRTCDVMIASITDFSYFITLLFPNDAHMHHHFDTTPVLRTATRPYHLFNSLNRYVTYIHLGKDFGHW